MDKKTTLADLAAIFAQKAQLPTDAADTFCRGFFAVIQEGLSRDKFVKIRGFGTFKTVTVGERESMNIHTGERTVIGEHEKVSFTPDASLKALINRPFAHFQTVVIEEGVSIDELNSVANDEFADDDTLDDNEPDMAADTSAEGNDAKEEKAVEQTEEISSTQHESVPNDNMPSADSADSVPAQPTSTANNEEEDIQATKRIQDTETNDADVSATDNEDEAPDTSATETPASTGTILFGQEEEDHNTEHKEKENYTTSPTSFQSVSAGNDDTNLDDDNTRTSAQEDIENGDDTEDIGADNEGQAPTESDAETTTSNVSGSQMAAGDVQYVIVPPPHRGINWWKTIALCLFLLLLMTLSYFAGYYKVFCPPCGPVNTPTLHDNAPLCPADTTPAAKAVETNDSTAAQQADSLSVPAGNAHESKEQTEQSAAKAAPSQADSIRYHVVQPGETLYGIARHYYGDKRAARRLIEANHIPDSDCITVGQKLRIPPMEKRAN